MVSRGDTLSLVEFDTVSIVEFDSVSIVEFDSVSVVVFKAYPWCTSKQSSVFTGIKHDYQFRFTGIKRYICTANLIKRDFIASIISNPSKTTLL